MTSPQSTLCSFPSQLTAAGQELVRSIVSLAASLQGGERGGSGIESRHLQLSLEASMDALAVSLGLGGTGGVTDMGGDGGVSDVGEVVGTTGSEVELREVHDVVDVDAALAKAAEGAEETRRAFPWLAFGAGRGRRAGDNGGGGSGGVRGEGAGEGEGRGVEETKGGGDGGAVDGSQEGHQLANHHASHPAIHQPTHQPMHQPHQSMHQASHHALTPAPDHPMHPPLRHDSAYAGPPSPRTVPAPLAWDVPVTTAEPRSAKGGGEAVEWEWRGGVREGRGGHAGWGGAGERGGVRERGGGEERGGRRQGAVTTTTQGRSGGEERSARRRLRFGMRDHPTRPRQCIAT